MAAPQCMSGDGNPAVFVGTFLRNGEPVALCADCLAPWAAALIEAVAGVDVSAALYPIPPDGDTSRDDNDDIPADPDREVAAPIGRTKDGYPVGRSRGKSGGREGRTGGHTTEAE